MDYTKLIDVGSKVTLAVVLMAILISGTQGWWVFGSNYADVKFDRDQWKSLALQATNLSVKATNQTITGVRATDKLLPLPQSFNADDVKKALSRVDNRLQFVTEPTDAPIIKSRIQ